jgi:hypothetical protein
MVDLAWDNLRISIGTISDTAQFLSSDSVIFQIKSAHLRRIFKQLSIVLVKFIDAHIEDVVLCTMVESNQPIVKHTCVQLHGTQAWLLHVQSSCWMADVFYKLIPGVP